MASCDTEIISSTDKEKTKKLSEIDNVLNVVRVIDYDAKEETTLTQNASLEKAMCLKPQSNDSFELDLTEDQNNAELMKKMLKRERKKERRKERRKGMQNVQKDINGDISLGKNKSNEEDLSLESECMEGGHVFAVKTSTCGNGDSTCEERNMMIEAKIDAIDVPIKEDNVIDHDATEDTSLTEKSSLESDTCLKPPISYSLELDLTEDRCDMKLMRKRLKNRRQKERRKAMRNGQKDLNGDISLRESKFQVGDSILEFERTEEEEDYAEKISLSRTKGDSARDEKKMLIEKNNDTVDVTIKKGNVIGHDVMKEISSTGKASLETDTCSTLPTNGPSGLRLTEDQCNMKLMNKSLKRKRQKERRKVMQNAQKDLNEDTSLRENMFNEGDLGPDFECMEVKTSSRCTNGDSEYDREKTVVDVPIKRENVINHDATGKNSLTEKTSLESQTCLKPPTNDGSEIGLAEDHCNVKLTKTKLKRKKQKLMQNTREDLNGDASLKKNEHKDGDLIPNSELMEEEHVFMEKASSCDGKTMVTETKNDSMDVCVKKDNNPQVPLFSLKVPRAQRAKKKLLILDLNGLLADLVPYVPNGFVADTKVSKKSVFKRPFCEDFLQFCFEKFNVGVWSSRAKRNVELLVDFLMGESRHKLLFCWDQSHCTHTGLKTIEHKTKPMVLKELTKLWEKSEDDLPWKKGQYNASNTLLVDDSPYKALRNPAHTAIFPRSYQYKDREDFSLGPGGDLRVYLERLAEAQNVQEFVAQNPFGQRAITESNPSWGFYSKIIDLISSRSQKKSRKKTRKKSQNIASSSVV